MLFIRMSMYQLTTELLRLSQSKNWDEAKLEWDLVDVERMEEPEQCICGHYPIIEVCTIRNNKTKLESRVGNCCVKKFNNTSDKIFRGVAKIRKDVEKSLNSETLSFAKQNGWIDTIEWNFYINVLRRRNLSEKQLNWKKAINKKIIFKINKKKL